MNVSFFDTVEASSFQSNFIENYFFVPYLSPKLGYKKFQVLRNSTDISTVLLQEKPKQVVSTWQNRCMQGIACCIQLLSFCTIIVPVAIAIAKLKHRKLHRYEIPSLSTHSLKNTITPDSASTQPATNDFVNTTSMSAPPTADAVISAPISDVFDPQETDVNINYFKNQWKNYKNIYNAKKTVYLPCLAVGLNGAVSDIQNTHDSTSWILPDTNAGNLLLDCENFVDTYFVPDTYALNCRNPLHILQPTDMDQIAEHLSHAFAAGKKIVVMRVSVNGHSLVAAFQKDGTYKIIDSMSWPRFSMKTITASLNKKNIKDQSGISIVFHGTYINTSIQKGGHECFRFATLYGYQIAKTGNLEGYRAINQAFLDGRLRRFQDAQTIEGCEGPEHVHVAVTRYREFMHSWAYASIGLVDIHKWQDIPLSTLRAHANSLDSHFGCSCFVFSDRDGLSSFSDGCGKKTNQQEDFCLVVQQNQDPKELDLPLQELPEEDCTLEELLSKQGKGLVCILVAKQKKIFLAKILYKTSLKISLIRQSQAGKRLTRTPFFTPD